jgi:hypothetical protein
MHLLIVKAVGTYIYRSVLKGKIIRFTRVRKLMLFYKEGFYFFGFLSANRLCVDNFLQKELLSHL